MTWKPLRSKDPRKKPAVQAILEKAGLVKGKVTNVKFNTNFVTVDDETFIPVKGDAMVWDKGRYGAGGGGYKDHGTHEARIPDGLGPRKPQ